MPSLWILAPPAAAVSALIAWSGAAGGGPDHPAASRSASESRAPATRAATLGCGEGTPRPAAALAPDWPQRSVIAGPVTFLYARDNLRNQTFTPARRQLRALLRERPRRSVRRRALRTLRHAPPGGHGIHGLFLLLEPGAAATVAVPRRAAARLALVYSRRARRAERPEAQGIVRLRDGDRVLRLRPCASAERTHFIGGVVATRGGCAPVNVYAGRGRPLLRYLPLGTGRRRCDRRSDKARASGRRRYFAPCRPGPEGGGYRVRIVGISCRDARAALPRMLGPDKPRVVRRRERVYVNDDGWSCLVQSLRRMHASQVACIRRRQLIFYRVS